MKNYFSPEDLGMLMDFQEIYPWFLQQGDAWPVRLSDLAADAAGAWLSGSDGDTFREILAIEAIKGSSLLAEMIAGALGVEFGGAMMTPEEVRAKLLGEFRDRLDRFEQAGAAG